MFSVVLISSCLPSSVYVLNPIKTVSVAMCTLVTKVGHNSHNNKGISPCLWHSTPVQQYNNRGSSNYNYLIMNVGNFVTTISCSAFRPATIIIAPNFRGQIIS